MTRNVTIDPLAPAHAVTKPEIDEVMSLSTGRFYGATRFIGRRSHETVSKIRNLLRERMHGGRSGLVCAKCWGDVYLVCSPTKAFFFRHRTEDGSCPALTRHPISDEEIRARKYAGAQESEAHKRLKRLLMRSIAADSRFSDYAEERTWRSLVSAGQYRRPDVSCRLGELWLAFEGQLSTTFLSVVAGRRAFYRAEGGLLVWVLSRFDPGNRRMTDDDILFPNNSNVLVVDEETTAASEATGRFLVRCYYRLPNVRELSGAASWGSRIAGFDELTLDVPGQRAFLVDVEGEEKARRQHLARVRDSERNAADEQLRTEFLAFAVGDEPIDYFAALNLWAGFATRFAERGIDFPTFSEMGRGFHQLMKALVSAREGIPVGWKLKRLVEVAHLLYSGHPQHVLVFGLALKAYGRADLLLAQDESGRWAPKAQRLRVALSRGGEEFAPDRRWLPVVGFVFPEAKATIASFFERPRRIA